MSPSHPSKAAVTAASGLRHPVTHLAVREYMWLLRRRHRIDHSITESTQLPYPRQMMVIVLGHKQQMVH